MEMDVDAGPSTLPPNPAAKVNGVHRSPASSEAQQQLPAAFEASIHGLPISTLSGTQDLLSIFQLDHAYDRHVRPYISVASTAAGLGEGKGKGKATDAPTPTPAFSTAAPAAGINAQPNGVKTKPKAMKKHYSHMIIDVPGENILAKDRHMRDLLMNPDPPDPLNLSIFDAQAIRDAFTLEVGPCPDFDNSRFRADATEERKSKKKKRKQDDGDIVMNGAPSPMNANTPGAQSLPSAAGGTGKKRRTEGKTPAAT